MAIEQAIGLGSEYFNDPNVGRPVFNGSVYIGKVDLDPKNIADRITVTVIEEDGVTVIEEDGTRVAISPAAQPLLTGAGGTIIYNGKPVSVVTDLDYSIRVDDSQGSQVYYFPFVQNNALALSLITKALHDTVVAMVADTTLVVGLTVETKSYYAWYAPVNEAPKGGATYNIVTTADYTNITGNISANGYGDHILANGNVAMIVRGPDIDTYTWGIVADGVTDEILKLQDCVDQLITVILPFSSIAIGSPLTVHSISDIRGQGRNNSVIKTLTNTIHGLVFDANARKAHLRDFSITSGSGIGVNNHGISSNVSIGFAETTLSHVDVNGFKYGLYFEALCWQNKFTQMRFQGCEWGIFGNDTVGNSINNLYEHLYVESGAVGGFKFTACNLATFDTCNFGGSGSEELLKIGSTGRATLINCNFEAVSILSGKGVVSIAGTSNITLMNCHWQANSGVSGLAYELLLSSFAQVVMSNCTIQAQGINMSNCLMSNNSELRVLDDSFNTGITHLSGSTALTKVYRPSAPIQVLSSPIDLSGPAEEYVIFNTGAVRAGRVTRIALIYTESSSADTGITLTIKSADNVDVWATELTEVSQPIWYVKEVALSKTIFRENDTMIVVSPGAKTGSGVIQVLMEYVIDTV